MVLNSAALKKSLVQLGGGPHEDRRRVPVGLRGGGRVSLCSCDDTGIQA